MDDNLIEEIVQKTVERMLKILPEVIGNLMMTQAANSKLVENFYNSNPEFANHKEVVREIISKVEGDNHTLSYNEILSMATPKIKSAIATCKDLGISLDTDSTNGAI